MAILGVISVSITSAENPPYVSGDVLKIFFDTDTSAFSVYKNGVLTGSGVTLGEQSYISYPPFGQPTPVFNYWIFPIDNNGNSTLTTNSFCNGTTLVTFNFIKTFPYSTLFLTENSPSCDTGVYCDIAFTGLPITTNASDNQTPNGTIQVNATTSHGPLRFSLSDDTYANMTNTTGYFSGLFPGIYTVYVKDSASCSVSYQVEVKADFNYGIKYRLEYYDVNNAKTRIDILKSGFVGSYEVVKCEGSGINLRLRGDNGDFYTSILATEASVPLFSETNFQFLDLYTENERQYQLRHYKDFGSGYGELWRGFIMPGLYQEEYYTDTNYFVNAEFTDQIAYLKDLPFVDTSDKIIKGSISLLSIIVLILNKTDLDLKFRIATNIYEVNHNDGPSDEPLDQTFVIAEDVYTNEQGEVYSCYEVLDNILKSFGARLFQWNGYWNIVRIDQNTSIYNYRIFNKNGIYESNGSLNPLLEIKRSLHDKAFWIEKSQNLEVVRSIGKAIVSHKLKEDPYGFKNGGFEKGYANNWTLVLNGNSASLGSATGNNSFIAAYISSQSNSSTYANDAYLLSDPVPITYNYGDTIKFRFDVYPFNQLLAQQYPTLIKFRYSLKVGNSYLTSGGLWTTDPSKEFVDVVIERGTFNKWQTIEVDAILPYNGVSTTTTYQLKLMHGGFTPELRNDPILFTTDCWSVKDLNTLSNTISTTDKPLGYIILMKTLDYGNILVYRWYKLTAGDNTTSNVTPFANIRPNDYNAVSNRVYWELYNELRDSFNSSGITGKVTASIFDNVRLQFLPEGKASPETKSYEQVNTSKIKHNYEIELINGDAPFTIRNSQNTYLNYYRLEDGTPTAFWYRDGFTEQLSILPLLSKQILEQFRRPKIKITGRLGTKQFFGFDVALQDGSRTFIPYGMTINDRLCEYDIELQEVASVDPNGTTTNPFNTAEFVINEFGQDYDI